MNAHSISSIALCSKCAEVDFVGKEVALILSPVSAKNENFVSFVSHFLFQGKKELFSFTHCGLYELKRSENCNL